MGGFGSGGRRNGSGRKSKAERERALAGSRERTRARDAAAPRTRTDAPAVAVKQPIGMTPIASGLWRLLAPAAVEAGTLVAGTAYAFRRLCELEARRRAMEAQIDLDGLMVNPMQVDEDTGRRFSIGAPVAHPLITHERALQVRVEQGMARFMITALGKSMKLMDPEESDPFAEFGKLQIVQGGKS